MDYSIHNTCVDAMRRACTHALHRYSKQLQVSGESDSHKGATRANPEACSYLLMPRSRASYVSVGSGIAFSIHNEAICMALAMFLDFQRHYLALSSDFRAGAQNQRSVRA